MALWPAVGGAKHNTYKMETDQPGVAAITFALENYYLKGIYEGDLDALHQVYYPGSLLFGDVKGEPYFKTLSSYFEAVQHRQSPADSGKEFSGEIIAINVVNSIAVAELKVKMYDFHYHEFLSFHQINGRWVIVNKMMSDVHKTSNNHVVQHKRD